ncbi:MAG: hypothetical protein Q8S24_06415 [Eubacteriales bacterium]|nr:hypothetical protein [Eubacteriales bacterium]
MNIGIKFCGGCNPRFDRLEFVSQIKKTLTYHTYRPYLEGTSDLTLVVCGCKRACVNLGIDEASDLVVVDNSSSIERVVESICQMEI